MPNYVVDVDVLEVRNVRRVHKDGSVVVDIRHVDRNVEKTYLLVITDMEVEVICMVNFPVQHNSSSQEPSRADG